MNRNVILVTIDSLGASFLGPYGNSYIPTPGFNRFASNSRVFDNCLADNPSVDGLMSALISGRHAASDFDASESDTTLPEELTKHAIRSFVISDDAELTKHSIFDRFDELLPVEVSAAVRAERVEQTQLFSVIATGLAVLENLDEPSFVWIHASGMASPWDAPLDLRKQFHDEDDPPPSDLLEVPCAFDTNRWDPDELFPIAMAYAGQVTLVDLCWELMIQSVAEAGYLSDSLIVLTSPRGFPLGDHGIVGLNDARLYGESVHVPLMIYAPTKELGGDRCSALVQLQDVHGTIRDWLGLAPAANANIDRPGSLLQTRFGKFPCGDRMICLNSREQAIRTPAWYLIDDGVQPELYCKPDDLWEVNNVADKCSDVARLLAQLLEHERQRHRDPDPGPAQPLDQILLGFV